jgi:transcriptional regulator with XRE-family HTH domain
MSASSLKSSIACVLIDGDKIRQIRQEQGLTQLYVATSLGITTDTVSRWENKRSPSIKQENAEKLAEVLEVELEVITLVPEEEEVPKETVAEEVSTPEKVVPPPTVSSKNMWILPVLMIVLVAGFLVYRVNRSAVVPVEISAERFLPEHASPYLPFPVLIRVHTADQTAVSFILRESFPDSCDVVNGIPPFTAQNSTGVKWINTTGVEDLYFGYLARPANRVHGGDTLVFDGLILVDNNEQPVVGETVIQMADYHWADRNHDYRIDDNEILTIYSSFDLFKQMGVDIEKIQQIWAGHGYLWDMDRKEFSVITEITTSDGE